MTILERDVTYIVLSVYLLTLMEKYSLNRKQETIPALGLSSLLIATCALYLTFLAPLTLEILTVSPNFGRKTLIRGHPRGFKVVPLDSTGMISY